jgi:formylglycine-generating enzyme required for sulfatase activity
MTFLFKLLRGGSWLALSGGCRSAFRFHGVPDGAGSFVGFRLVCNSSTKM